MKVALVYDHLNKLGGAEKILVELSRLYKDADWYTSVWDPKLAPFSRSWRVHTSFLQRFPFLRTHHELVPYLMPFAFESFDFGAYDLVISVGSFAAKGIITKPGTLHLNYCLTPTRYLWSHKEEYLNSRQYGPLTSLLKPLMRVVMSLLSRWDRVAATRPDVMIAISEQVKIRIKKYYNRDSAVVYPPVEFERFASHSFHSTTSLPPSYYLAVSRLVPYKRLDILVEAFNHSGRRLVIVGEGVELSFLKRRARENITFAGKVAEKDLVTYYEACRAYVAAQVEDFGIAMVEAQAAGKPVIAYNEGGAREIVRDGETGILYTSQTATSLNEALDRFETMGLKEQKCRANAARFSTEKWRLLIQKEIEKAWTKI